MHFCQNEPFSTVLRAIKTQPAFSSRHNNVAIAIHVIWTTQDREPRIIEAIESSVYVCIVAEATKLECKVLAINGMPDHVHVVLLLHPTTCLSKLMNQMKGSSSHLVNHVLVPGGGFRWDMTYATFSMSRCHRDRAVAYIQNQKLHHASQTTYSYWEHSVNAITHTFSASPDSIKSKPSAILSSGKRCVTSLSAGKRPECKRAKAAWKSDFFSE